MADVPTPNPRAVRGADGRTYRANIVPRRSAGNRVVWGVEITANGKVVRSATDAFRTARNAETRGHDILDRIEHGAMPTPPPPPVEPYALAERAPRTVPTPTGGQR